MTEEKEMLADPTGKLLRQAIADMRHASSLLAKIGNGINPGLSGHTAQAAAIVRLAELSTQQSIAASLASIAVVISRDQYSGIVDNHIAGAADHVADAVSRLSAALVDLADQSSEIPEAEQPRQVLRFPGQGGDVDEYEFSACDVCGAEIFRKLEDGARWLHFMRSGGSWPRANVDPQFDHNAQPVMVSSSGDQSSEVDEPPGGMVGNLAIEVKRGNGGAIVCWHCGSPIWRDHPESDWYHVEPYAPAGGKDFPHSPEPLTFSGGAVQGVVDG